MLQRGQQWLIDRGLLSRELSVREAVEQAPGRRHRRRRHGGRRGLGLRRRRLRPGHDPDPRVLPAASTPTASCARSCGCFRARERPRVEDACRRVSTKVSAWLGGQLLLGGHHRQHGRARAVPAGRAVLLRARAHRRHRRDDPGRRSAARGGSGRRGRIHRVAGAGARRRASSSSSSSRSRTTCSCRR